MANPRAYVITGPTSGIGYQTALDMVPHGTLILVGRNARKLADVKATIEVRGGKAVAVIADMADPVSVKRAAAEIVALPYEIAGVLNNAGVREATATQNALGWDATFATNYLGPFVFIEALIPHLADGTQIVNISSGIEDPERAPAKAMGMRGGQFISVDASAHGQWKPGGTKMAGMDAYATSKQCILAATLGWAREVPRLRFNAVEPGIIAGTGLGGGESPLLVFIFGQIVTRLPPFAQFRSTTDGAAWTITQVLTQKSTATGVYFSEKAKPMHGSTLAHDPAFEDRLLEETRAFLA